MSHEVEISEGGLVRIILEFYNSPSLSAHLTFLLLFSRIKINTRAHTYISMALPSELHCGPGSKKNSKVKIRLFHHVEAPGNKSGLAFGINLKLVRILSYFDLASSYLLTILCILSMFSEWRFFNIKWPHVNDPLSKLLLSQFPKKHNKLDLTSDSATLNYAMAGQIIVLCIYIARVLAASNLLRAMTLNLRIPTKLDLCKSWIFVAAFLICINSTALVCSPLGIPFQIVFLSEVIFRIGAVYQVAELQGYFESQVQAEGILKQVMGDKSFNEKRQKPKNVYPGTISSPSVIYTESFLKAQEGQK
ncbi:unnamed protein product [Allacma fusca]|uniref:Uncharacterized protein n=1 Tax=Allacma fusca TaxID=39272 RepID=A0A8J2LLS9_9HEXA|nr:unnamed protein product [Allacma fusca]